MPPLVNGMKPGLEESIFWDLGGGSRNMEIVIAVRIFDLSSETLYLCQTHNDYRES